MKKYPLAQPEIIQADIDAVTQVLKSHQLSRGPVINEFEKEFCKITQSNYASAVSSGTAGLIIALQALGVKENDEVITVSFTVPATVNSIVAIGATPIMIDIEDSTLGMCPGALKRTISTKTKAIIVVHAFGKAANMCELLSIAKYYNIPVIEDACEAIGNSYQQKPLGSMADIGVFAFYPNKQITTGEGGMLVTNNQKLHAKFEILRNHGRSMNGDLYDQVSFGWNFRMSDINAALGLSQLKRIKHVITKRQKIAQLYNTYLSEGKNITCPSFSAHESSSAWFVYVVRLAIHNRNTIIQNLNRLNIQCGRYFAPVHLQPYYKKKTNKNALHSTETIAKKCLALPFYTQMTENDIKFICINLIKYTQ